MVYLRFCTGARKYRQLGRHKDSIKGWQILIQGNAVGLLIFTQFNAVC